MLTKTAFVILCFGICLAQEPESGNEIVSDSNPTPEQDAITRCRALNEGFLFSLGHDTNNGCSLSCYVIGSLNPYMTHHKPDLTPCPQNANGTCFSGICYKTDNRVDSIAACKNATGNDMAVAMTKIELLNFGLTPDCSVFCHSPNATGDVAHQLKVTPIREGEQCASLAILSAQRVCQSGECKFPTPAPNGNQQDATSRCQAMNPNVLLSFGHETNLGCSLTCYAIGTLNPYSTHNKPDLTPCPNKTNSSCFSGLCYQTDHRNASVAACVNATGNDNAVSMRNIGIVDLDFVPDCSVYCYTPNTELSATHELKVAPIREGEPCTSISIFSSSRVCKSGECKFQIPNLLQLTNN